MGNGKTTKERLATIETQVKDGFQHISTKLDNHLTHHAHIEKFRGKLIIASFSLAGTLSVGLLLMIIKQFLSS